MHVMGRDTKPNNLFVPFCLHIKKHKSLSKPPLPDKNARKGNPEPASRSRQKPNLNLEVYSTVAFHG